MSHVFSSAAAWLSRGVVIVVYRLLWSLTAAQVVIV
jgi:hypothetical protein